MLAGMTSASGSTLLPAAFTKGSSAPPKRAEGVAIGEAQAYRFADLEADGVDGGLTILAAPTTAGIATMACLGGADDRARCEAAAGSLTLSDGARAFALGPSKRYARELGAPLDRLSRRRDAALDRMRSAKTPDKQAAAVRAAAAAYASAGRAVTRVEPNPPERTAHAQLGRALTRARGPYKAAADAARGDRRQAYARARRSARAGDAAVNRALAQFKALGYQVR
jgi:hypothetical protein